MAVVIVRRCGGLPAKSDEEGGDDAQHQQSTSHHTRSQRFVPT